MFNGTLEDYANSTYRMKRAAAIEYSDVTSRSSASTTTFLRRRCIGSSCSNGGGQHGQVYWLVTRFFLPFGRKQIPSAGSFSAEDTISTLQRYGLKYHISQTIFDVGWKYGAEESHRGTPQLGSTAKILLLHARLASKRSQALVQNCITSILLFIHVLFQRT